MPDHAIIIDTDPGIDDAVAILTALASPEIEVLGVTTVAGNVPIGQTTRNGRAVVALAGRPGALVHRGCAGPLLLDLQTAESVHGADGLAEVDLPTPEEPAAADHAIDWIVDTVTARPEGSVTLCALGPLTNIAAAFTRAPEIAPRLAGIVLMGGAVFVGGNTTPVAEFNMAVDPHAADIVFRSGAAITMLPLDCTHKTLMTNRWIDQIDRLGSPVGHAVAAMLRFYQRFDMERYAFAGGPLHDPNVIAYLLKPDLYAVRRCHVAVETDSPLTRGMTVTDWWGRFTAAPNCGVVHDVDADGFFDLVAQRLADL